MFRLQDLVELIRLPRAMQPTFREDQRLDRFGRAVRTHVRLVATRLQPFQALQRIALRVLVASLAADPKLLAQIRDRKAIRLRQRDKSNYLFHVDYFLPRHSGDM